MNNARPTSASIKPAYDIFLFIKNPTDYISVSKDDIRVSDVGRFRKDNPDDEIETWSHHSGEPIPESCRIGELEEATIVDPVRLDMAMEDREYSLMSTNKYFSAKFVLNWAEKEDFNLSNITFCASRQQLKWMMMAAKTAHQPGARHPGARLPCARQGTECFLIYVFKGIIFIESDPKLVDNGNEKNVCWWGKKYSDMMRSGGRGTPGFKGQDVQPRVTRVIDIGQHHILTASKVDCQYPGAEHDVPENYIELKTNLELKDKFSKDKFAGYKSREVWAHCTLGNVNTVYFGFRTWDGLLTSVVKYTADELEMIGAKFWRPTEMLSFLGHLLSWVRDNVEEGESYTLMFDGDTISLSEKDHPMFVSVIQENYPGTVQG